MVIYVRKMLHSILQPFEVWLWSCAHAHHIKTKQTVIGSFILLSSVSSCLSGWFLVINIYCHCLAQDYRWNMNIMHMIQPNSTGPTSLSILGELFLIIGVIYLPCKGRTFPVWTIMLSCRTSWGALFRKVSSNLSMLMSAFANIVRQ